MAFNKRELITIALTGALLLINLAVVSFVLAFSLYVVFGGRVVLWVLARQFATIVAAIIALSWFGARYKKWPFSKMLFTTLGEIGASCWEMTIESIPTIMLFGMGVGLGLVISAEVTGVPMVTPEQLQSVLVEPRIIAIIGGSILGTLLVRLAVNALGTMFDDDDELIFTETES